MKEPPPAAADGAGHAARQRLVSALDELATASASRVPGALRLAPEQRARLEAAVQRARARLAAPDDHVLTIALAGMSGTGKSTLINALAGSPIALVTGRRGATTQPQVYHHRDVPAGGLPPDLAARARFVPHDRPELRTKVVIDTPDLNTLYTNHRRAAKAALKAAGLVLYVFEPETYWDERVWSVIREEGRFSACAAVLNRSDRATDADRERIVGEIRRRFGELGHGDMRIFRTVASAHVPDASGRLPADPDDDFPALRAFVERELRTGDLARMARQQRRRVLEHLRDAVDQVAPPDWAEQADKLEPEARKAADAAADELVGQWQDCLAAAEAHVEPLLALRLHQRFWGPLRAWLVLCDALRFGIGGWARGALKLLHQGDPAAVDEMLATCGPAAADALQAAAGQVQTRLHEAQLPLGPWVERTARPDGLRVAAEVAREIRARAEVAAARSAGRGRAVVNIVSGLAAAGSAAVVAVALYRLTVDLTAGRYDGFALLGNAVSLIALFLALMHVASALLLTGGRIGSAGGAQATRDAVRGVLREWLQSYRDQIVAEVQSLRGPLGAVEESLQLLDAFDAGEEDAPLPQPASSAVPIPIDEAPEHAEPAGREVRQGEKTPEVPVVADAEEEEVAGVAVETPAAAPQSSQPSEAPLTVSLADRLRAARARREGSK